jgi:hypothetical protein
LESLGYVATHPREDAEGEKTAGKAADQRGNPSFGGARVIRLWRGAKGYERFARGICVSRALHGAKTSEASCKAKAIEGVEKPIRPLAPLRYTLEVKPTP